MALPQRDEKGRFQKGNGGGPGRPRLQLEEAYFRAFTDGISEDDIKIGARKLAEKLRRGDPSTWKIVMPYLMSQATQKVGGDKENPLEIIFRYAEHDTEDKDS